MRGRAFTLMMVWLLVAPGALHAGPVQLPQTGQRTCWNADGLQVACSGPAGQGQDGDLEKGAAWPIPRFTDNGQTITDNLTSLMWTKDANAPGPSDCGTAIAKTWQEALDHVKCLNVKGYLNYDDWRLPNVNELESLVNYDYENQSTWLESEGPGFVNVQANEYWSSSSFAVEPPNASLYAWVFSMYAGYLQYQEKSFGRYVWPVRAYLGVVAAPIPADGAIDVSTRPILAWVPVSGASAYDLYLWKQGEAKPELAAPTITSLSAGSVKIGTTLAVSFLYHWQVVARNSSGKSTGPEWSFTTRAHTLGDINGDNQVDLADALLSLQVLAGIRGGGVRTNYPASGTDVSGDGKIGLEETIYILQEVAEIR